MQPDVESDDDDDDGLNIGWPVALMMNAAAVILAVVGLIRLACWLLG